MSTEGYAKLMLGGLFLATSSLYLIVFSNPGTAIGVLIAGGILVFIGAGGAIIEDWKGN